MHLIQNVLYIAVASERMNDTERSKTIFEIANGSNYKLGYCPRRRDGKVNCGLVEIIKFVRLYKAENGQSPTANTKDEDILFRGYTYKIGAFSKWTGFLSSKVVLTA